MKLKKAIIALYQKIVTVLYLYSYTNLSFQEVMLLWQRITAMIWMRPEIPRTNMTTEARTAVRTAPRTRARTMARTKVRITVRTKARTAAEIPAETAARTAKIMTDGMTV